MVIAGWLAALLQRLDAITLGPANIEDLTTYMPQEMQVAATTHTTIEVYPHIVQAELRHGEPWSDTDLKTILNKGKKRESPNTLLTENKTLPYLLVTSAATQGADLGLRMASACGAWPSKLPPDIGSRLPGQGWRIAVPNVTNLDGWLRDLLQTTCKMPRPHFSECIKDWRTV